jgi:DNA helicase-2/ATP-dependent DNA helicase PcrA
MRIHFESELDPDQYRAVVATEGPLLIIAGAGSGKTRVITYRIAKLLSQGVPQEAILALTFTNKAAREMALRAQAITGLALKNLHISTFHSFGAWFLRREIHRSGWKENFTIYDEQDRLHAVKECARDLGFSADDFDPVKAAAWISSRRTGFGKESEESPLYPALYEEYRRGLKVYNAVDFDDLIAMPLELLTEHPATAEALGRRFRYVMVDEFQDTSNQQYRLVKAFAGDNLCAVGDDDQSIYSWRGANFGNIEAFERDHPNFEEIKLERNYRSTGIILDAANALISHNSKRKKKNLWSPGGQAGVPISLSVAEDEDDESATILSTMKTLRISESLPWDAFGILVRTNGQSRVIEEALLESGLPYRTAGGPSFYQRREVRDMLAYLRAAANPDDDTSVLRIINVPRRGIGKTGLERLTSYSRSRNISMAQAIARLDESGDQLAGMKSMREAAEFFAYIGSLREAMLKKKKDISACVRDIVKDTGYWHFLLEEHKADEKTAAWKYRNLDLLANSIERWEKDPDTMDRGLYAYLSRVALSTRDDPEDEDGKVSLLTIHSAKGLEFEVVFIPGCEEGILPHARSMEEGGGDIEEERRLFYVALTRARRKLFLSRCACRVKRGQRLEAAPSPFLGELPEATVTSPQSAVPELSEEELRKKAFEKMRKMFVPAPS